MTQIYFNWFALTLLAIAMDIANLFLAPIAVHQSIYVSHLTHLKGGAQS